MGRKLDKRPASVVASLSARVGSIGDNGLGGWYSCEDVRERAIAHCGNLTVSHWASQCRTARVGSRARAQPAAGPVCSVVLALIDRMSKTALNQFTKCLSIETKRDNCFPVRKPKRQPAT